MGYTTDFSGEISIEPPLSAEEIAFLTKFNCTRRMRRGKGPYYVDGGGFMGQGDDTDTDILDGNSPPEGQPGLWCQWEPSDDGTVIQWDGGEKFYNAAEWMAYLVEHFIGAAPLAKRELPFLEGHVCNGEILAAGEDPDDRWMLVVKNNRVTVRNATISYGPDEDVS
jgi:hypothetical protein